MTDRLDEIIREILEHPETQLSAEAINALLGATSGHPWCKNKTVAQRQLEARFAIAGRQVLAQLLHNLERAV